MDSAAVYWNASTRFTDGAEFGFGAEMGISTQKLHCRGPFALAELTSSKYEDLGQRPGAALGYEGQASRSSIRAAMPIPIL